jgi:MHS family proline/betaine transporter-like MFS transporter
MLWALLLGGFAVVLIDVVPDYVALGVAASVAVALLRILQGFSIGGEWEAADNYILENVAKRRRLSHDYSVDHSAWLTAASVFPLLEAILGSKEVGWRATYRLAAVAVVVDLLFKFRFGVRR